MITASVAETAPGWLHPRDGRGPPASGWAAQGLTPTVVVLPAHPVHPALLRARCPSPVLELAQLAQLLPSPCELPAQDPASALTEAPSAGVLRRPAPGGPATSPASALGRPSPQGAPLARVLCGPGRSLPCISAQPVSDCPSLSSCSFEDTPLSPFSAAPVLSMRPGQAFQTTLSPLHPPPAPERPSAQPQVGSDLLNCFSVSAPLLCR